MAWETINRIVDCVQRYRLARTSEDELQAALAEALQRDAIPFEREVPLGAGRVDFWVNDVAIELKVQGSRADVARQVIGYLEDPRCAGLVLVTTRHAHTLPPTIAGKPVRVFWLGAL